MKRLLLFQPTIAPYRIDLVNDLAEAFDARICLAYRNLLNQTFDYDKIEARFRFEPHYMRRWVQVRSKVLSRGYWSELDRHRPDIVVVSEFGPDAIAAILHRKLKRRHYKIVSICDDSYNMLADDNDFSALHRRLREWVVPRIDELLLVEPNACQWYREHYGKGHWFPIIANDEATRSLFSAALPISRELVENHKLDGKRVFLFVGRLIAIKNVATAIKAFSEAAIPDSAFVIVGDGSERKALEKQAQSSKSEILFTGRLEGEALYAWYNLAQCLILASIQEPFGAVTNEMLMGGVSA